ncbi:MAG: DUF1080 domain-containing protein [Bacillota bacterium]
MKLRNWALLAVFSVSAVGVGAGAAEKTAARKADQKTAKVEKKLEAFTDAEKAGPALKVQGEYEGKAGSSKVGIQVIALGGDMVRAVFYRGGLPGAGAEGKAAAEVEAKSQDGKVVFKGQSYNATLADGKLTGKTDKGESFEAKKVIRKSPTLGLKPPAGATVLFDGSNADAFNNGKMTDQKLLMMGAVTKRNFKDFTLHVEFILPFMPDARGQARANSGVYLQNRYEVQILDSFGLKGLNNECGGIYTVEAPKVNMCLPPLQWQTYDIDFTAAKFDASGKKTANAKVTVKLNGVLIHEGFEIPKKTGGGSAEGPTAGPIQLQNHGNPVYFRNVWVVEKK